MDSLILVPSLWHHINHLYVYLSVWRCFRWETTRCGALISIRIGKRIRICPEILPSPTRLLLAVRNRVISQATVQGMTRRRTLLMLFPLRQTQLPGAASATNMSPPRRLAATTDQLISLGIEIVCSHTGYSIVHFKASTGLFDEVPFAPAWANHHNKRALPQFLHPNRRIHYSLRRMFATYP